MTVSSEAARQAFAFAMATPVTGTIRQRRDRSDFGDPGSYLLKVRRIGRNYPFGDDVQDGDFGIYLGVHDVGYLVAIQAIFPSAIIGYESFTTLADLKVNWELDRRSRSPTPFSPFPLSIHPVRRLRQGVTDAARRSVVSR